jgi:hypothetical protein
MKLIITHIDRYAQQSRSCIAFELTIIFYNIIILSNYEARLVLVLVFAVLLPVLVKVVVVIAVMIFLQLSQCLVSNKLFFLFLVILSIINVFLSFSFFV